MRPLQDAVAGALAEVLRTAPLSPGKVAFAWRTAVGPALARATTVRLEGGRLVIAAASPQWIRELARSQGVILARLQTLLGKDTVIAIDIRGGSHA